MKIFVIITFWISNKNCLQWSVKGFINHRKNRFQCWGVVSEHQTDAMLCLCMCVHFLFGLVSLFSFNLHFNFSFLFSFFYWEKKRERTWRWERREVGRAWDNLRREKKYNKTYCMRKFKRKLKWKRQYYSNIKIKKRNKKSILKLSFNLYYLISGGSLAWVLLVGREFSLTVRKLLWCCLKSYINFILSFNIILSSFLS